MFYLSGKITFEKKCCLTLMLGKAIISLFNEANIFERHSP